jgi:hypothetical protein
MYESFAPHGEEMKETERKQHVSSILGRYPVWKSRQLFITRELRKDPAAVQSQLRTHPRSLANAVDPSAGFGIYQVERIRSALGIELCMIDVNSNSG